MMKVVLLCALALVALSGANPISSNDLHLWESYKLQYLKSYATEAEELKRREIFINHLAFIRKHNAKFEAGEVTFTVGINKFADMSNEEFRAQMNGFKPSGARKGMKFNLTLTAEEEASSGSVDWRTKGAVTAVKDQGSCGGCWAFSATGALEAQNFFSAGTLTSLSEQNLIDCSSAYGNDGCSGGDMDYAFAYVEAKGGIDTESSYPFTGEDGSCKYKSKNKGGTCSGYVDITEGSESDLKTAVYKKGPVSIGMDASSEEFQLYESGIYGPSGCSTTDLDHGVLVVGYGTSSKKAYWLVKNSWGTSWGIEGYFMLARNKNNMCGVATMASYPTV